MLFQKAEKVLPTYEVGYQFNIKGSLVEITNIEEKEDGRFIYTFNGNAVVNAEKKYTDFTTMYISAQRAVNKGE